MSRVRRPIRLRVVAGTAADEPAPAVGPLLIAIAAGDQQAWKTVIDRFAPCVRSAARQCGLSSDEVDDVAQATWELLARHHASIQDPERLPGWLRIVAKREAVRHAQRRGRAIPTGDVDHVAGSIPAAVDTPDEEVLRRERAREVKHAAGHLSASCRHLLELLSADAALSYQDIARLTGMKVGSIGPKRARCLDCLGRRLDRRAS
jgi:RNA polymerase sigma factor (sigma-70 family)